MIIVNKLSAKDHSSVKSQSTPNCVNEKNRSTHSNWDLNHPNLFEIGRWASRDNEAGILAAMSPAQRRAVSIDVQRTVGNHFFRDFGFGITPNSTDFGSQGVSIQRKTKNLIFPKALEQNNDDEDEAHIRELIEQYNAYPIKIHDDTPEELNSQLMVLRDLASALERYYVMPFNSGPNVVPNILEEHIIDHRQERFSKSRLEFLNIIAEEEANVKKQYLDLTGSEFEEVPEHRFEEKSHWASSDEEVSAPRQALDEYLGFKFDQLSFILEYHLEFEKKHPLNFPAIYCELVKKEYVPFNVWNARNLIKPVSTYSFSCDFRGHIVRINIGKSPNANLRYLHAKIRDAYFVEYYAGESQYRIGDRVYLNIKPKCVRFIVKWLVENILMHPKSPFSSSPRPIHHFKVAVRPSGRRDNIVIYTRDEGTSAKIGKLIRSTPVISEMLNDEIPIMTERLGCGISRGAEPANVGSFSSLRARIISNILNKFLELGKVVEFQVVQAEILKAFRENGVDPDDPSRNLALAASSGCD